MVIQTVIALAIFVPTIAMSQSPVTDEVRTAIEGITRPGPQSRIAPEQVVGGLIAKHGRDAVANVAIEPLVAVLKGTNYQTRESAAWALFELKDRRSVEPLIEFLAVENLGDWGAEKTLVAIGEPSVGSLVVAFQSGGTNTHFLRKAARTLGDLKDPRAVAPLLEVFTMKDATLPWVCAEALGKIGGPAAVDGLAAALKSGTPAMKMNSAKALGQIKDPRAVPALLGALQEQDRNLRGEAARALGEIGDASATDALITALIDPRLGVEGETSTALGRMRSAGTADVMLRRFREAKDPAERASLLRALPQMGEPAVDVMIAMLKDDDAGIRMIALRNLNMLSAPGYVVSQGVSEVAQKRGREAILGFYDAGRADDLNYPERVSILASIKEPRAVRLLLRTLKTKEPGYENAPWYVPQDIFLAFEKAGPYAVDPLIEALDDPDLSVRAGAATMLGHIPVTFFGAPSLVEATVARIIERLGKVATDPKQNEVVRDKAIWSISRIGDAGSASLIVSVLNNQTNPVDVRRAAARASVGEKLRDRSVIVPLLAVYRDKKESQSLRVECAAALRALEHKFHDPKIAEAFGVVKMDRSEPSALRAASRTTAQLAEKIKSQAAAMARSAKAGQDMATRELPAGKKIWPKATVRNSSTLGERTIIQSETEGERAEIKAWYDKQLADWKVVKDWNAREIAVLMNGEWKLWSKQNTLCLIAVHDKERNGRMSVDHAFDREEELQDLLAEVPADVAHREKCKRNLQIIESAKSGAVRRFKLETGSAIEPAQLSSLIPGGFESLKCPDAGSYQIESIGKSSRCSVHGTQMAVGRR